MVDIDKNGIPLPSEMFLWRLWGRRHRERSGEAHRLSHRLGDFLRQHSCVLPSYKTWQMHLGSLWAGSKKLPALEFLQVFMLGNDVFNFLKIFIYYLCLCTHTCACSSMRVEVRGQLQKSILSFCHMGSRNQIRLSGLAASYFSCWAILPAQKISFMSLQYIHIFYEFCLTLWWPGMYGLLLLLSGCWGHRCLSPFC